jgi:hypothetical protein
VVNRARTLEPLLGQARPSADLVIQLVGEDEPLAHD